MKGHLKVFHQRLILCTIVKIYFEALLVVMICTFKLRISLGWLMINYQYTTCEYQEISLPKIFLSLGVFGHFGLKNETRKTVKIPKDFELYQVFMYSFLCQNVLIFLIYILLTNRTETLLFRDTSSIRDIRKF